MRPLAVIIAALTIGTGCSRAQEAPKQTVIAIQQSSTTVTVVEHRYAGPGQGSASGVVLLNVHDDENTSVEAGLDVLAARGGRLLELQHGGTRNLTFVMDTARFVADPNRMFTDLGARRSLERLSRYSLCAHAALRAFADTLLARTGLDTARTIVTLHNNTEANYNVRSYLPGAEYASDAAAVYVNPRADPDDFFFVTERALYDALRRRGFNVALQNNAAVTDDGSLSVLAARQHQRYVNVEAQHGHRAEQARMLTALLDVLARLR